MDQVVLHVEPGICGFCCQVRATRLTRRNVRLEVVGSDCKQIQALAQNLSELSMHDLFLPISRNPVFKAAEMAGCHLSCPLPTALIKAAEAALELALPRDVFMRFSDLSQEACHEEK